MKSLSINFDKDFFCLTFVQIYLYFLQKQLTNVLNTFQGTNTFTKILNVLKRMFYIEKIILKIICKMFVY